MNDTLDNFNFSQNVISNSKLKKDSLLKEKVVSDSGVFSNPDSEISFDDTLFLSESLVAPLEFKNDEIIETAKTLSTIPGSKHSLNNGIKPKKIFENERKMEKRNNLCQNRRNSIETNKILEDTMKLNILNENDNNIRVTSAKVNNEVNTKCKHTEEVTQTEGEMLRKNVLYQKEECLNTNRVLKINNTSNVLSNPVKITKKTKSKIIELVNSSINTNTKQKEKIIESSEMCKLSSWGLPDAILETYSIKKLTSMFQWQVECLNNENVLKNYKNLIYSAPTSAGKTLVAEILAIKTVFERRKKVIFILPFVSIVREKMYYFQDLMGNSGIRVEGFMGSYNPPGGFNSVQVAICTIEKANNLINRLLEEGTLSDIGAILVDEVHLLGDPHRGYLLELLLTKLIYISKKEQEIKIQIIGMSATLPNLSILAKWLEAELYKTDYRPIPLYEQAVVSGEVYNANFSLLRKLTPIPEITNDTDNILQLCLETIKDSCSILIFCPTKNWCENLAQQIASAFFKIGHQQNEWGVLLRNQLNTVLIMELLEQLKYCPVGLDDVLHKTVSFGVAFHHAGLTMDERDIIEAAFRNGALRILVATSTLSSGVNLPARRVIIRTPMFHGKPIDTLSYRQMIGRAGRMGKDTMGESFLICQKNDVKYAKELMSADLRSVESCLEGAGKLKRAILEVIASGVASSPEDIDLFTKSTLLAVEGENCDNDLSDPITEAVSFLKDNEFIRLQKEDDGTEKYVASSLGKACLSSSMAPDEGLALFTELAKARQCFVLETELHLIYLVTPYNACHSWGNIDWMFYLDLWEKLPVTMKRVGELVGIKESYIINATRGKIQTNTNKLYHKLLIHKRFFVALALQDLVNEKPLGWVCSKFNCNRGMLQSLQQSASSFAGMVTSFSRQLGWTSVELLISQFQDRLQFGVSRDLLDLMRLPILNGKMARTLFNSGIQTLASLANSTISNIENILHREVPFESEKGREGETAFEKKQRNKIRNVWITGKEGLTEREAAEMLVSGARDFLKLEMGLAEAKWESSLRESNHEPLEKGDTAIQSDIENLQAETSNILLFDNNTSKESNHEPLEKGNTAIQSDIKNLQAKTCKILLSDNNTSKESNHEPLEKGNTAIQSDIKNLQAKTCKILLSDNNILSTSTGKVTVKRLSDNLNISNHTDSSNSSNMSSDSTKIDDFDTQNSNGQPGSSNKSVHHPHLSTKFNATPLRKQKYEVSNILMSSPSAELNISGSSVTSNLNSSTAKTYSDQSLFDESLSLRLSDSEKDASNDKIDKNIEEKEKSCDVIPSSSILKNAFSETFNEESNISNKSEDIFGSPAPTESPDNVKKRRNSSIESNVTTPSKRQKTKLNESSGNEINFSYYENKLNSDIEPVNFSEIKIVDVCADTSLFDLFSKEIEKERDIALSLACTKYEEHRPSIGLKGKDQEVVRKNEIYSGYGRKLDGFSITWGANIAFYLSLNNLNYQTRITNLLKNLLLHNKHRIILFDSKEQIKTLKYCCGINIRTEIDDPKVADWLIDPEGKEKNMQAMAIKYCPESVKMAQIVTGCKGIGSIGLDCYSTVDSKTRSAIESVITWHLVKSLNTALKEINENYITTYDIEAATLKCLAKIEVNGISVKKESMQKLAETLKNLCNVIEKKAFSLAGRNFNFISSTDVAKVIGLYRGKKLSMKKQVLEQSDHPIAQLIIQWRKINSTMTKMIYPLIRVIKDDRIHGCYVTHTATGRITMHEPNLQNLVKDFEVMNPITQKNMKISCRKAFAVPEGHCLVSADYCQLELRILAHFSKDKSLCKIMTEPGDVFKSIAAKWNDINENKVTETMRQQTKGICYGIIYGMGAKALSEQLQLTETDAVVFMETFRNTYPGIKSFITKTIKICQENGYVETLRGRRRYLPHINESDSAKRGQAERQAVNTVIQGSAADIAKSAMVNCERELQEIFSKTKNKPKLVLHLHDELLYEVPLKYSRKVARILKKNMENSLKLSVPLPVKLKNGTSWGDMKEFSL